LGATSQTHGLFSRLTHAQCKSQHFAAEREAVRPHETHPGLRLPVDGHPGGRANIILVD
jgi:hypothetical protein